MRMGTWARASALTTSVVALGAMAVGGTSLAATHAASSRSAATKAADGNSCQLGNGVKHVVVITFDNVHYFRDNPNVPSDLEQIPALLNFIENNGTMLANNHTPLIAHTADDILTSYTGLYGDRAGMPISNDYQSYNADGTTDPAGSFAYWTDPVYDTAKTPNAGHDTNPSMVYASAPPATSNQTPDSTTPAPWVPFTRAGCDVGDFSTANTVLENTALDIPKVFGAGSPEDQQLINDKDSFKDQETADYVGVAVHCAQGSAFCADAKAVKYGQTTATASAATDSLPDEPGGYTGYQALFGHKYVAPQLGAGTPNLSHNGYEVTNSAGNLVDLSGNQINGGFLSTPGFPGFDPTASQSLAYMSDMLESGVPVVYGYISDIHGNEDIPGLAACKGAPDALGSGSACYVAQAQAYNTAFTEFFQRLAADGINASNTDFVFSSDEGDHEAGANVGRTIQPTPANCDGVNTPCTYPAGSFGELDANITGMLATQASDTTPLSIEADTAPEFYLTGNPGANDTTTRKVEHDVASLTADNPYAGQTAQKITNYIADPVEEGILHMVNADPARTPTFALFAKPDYYFYNGGTSCSGACVSVNSGFAWDHGDYAAEINTNWIGLVGPGVKHLGLDGDQPSAGPNSAGANSGQTEVVNSGTTGTWTDETDIRPTLMYLTGLKDDYTHDGRVITQVLSSPNSALQGLGSLGACYKQLNASVGQFGAYTLDAATAAVESNTPGDFLYKEVNIRLAVLEKVRDVLAGQIKNSLDQAAFYDRPDFGAFGQTLACQAIIGQAHAMAQQTGL